MSTAANAWDDRVAERYLQKYTRRHDAARSEAEARAVAALAELPPGAAVVDGPCGFGRHAIPLALSGYRVVGVDTSPVMLAEARRRAAGAAWPRWIRADYRRLPLRDGSADAVLNLFTSIGFLGDEGDLEVLREFGRVLRPGGRLVVDTAHRDALAGDRSSRAVRRELDGGEVLLERKEFDPDSGWLSIHHTYVDHQDARDEYRSRIRVYSVTELRRMLAASGFSDVEVYGDLDGGPFGDRSRLVAVARRPAVTAAPAATPARAATAARTGDATAPRRDGRTKDRTDRRGGGAAPVPAPASAAPRSSVERRLRAIWSQVLRRDGFGIHENFFEIGGTSFQALRALGLVKAEFGYDISLGAFIQAPTIAGTSMLLRGGASGLPEALVPIRPRGDRPPLFCFHAMGGSVARYFALAQALGDDQPVYGLQALGLVEGHPPQRSVEEMVATYVAEVLRVQPGGPHHLVGYSLGGILAFEAARVLSERTGTAPFVALIDTLPDYGDDVREDAPYRALADFILHVDIDPAEFHGLGKAAALRLLRNRAVATGLLSPRFPVDRLADIVDTVAANLAAVAGHRPGPFAGDVVLIRSDEPRGEDAPDLGWTAYARDVRTHFVGLGHFVVMEPKGAARVARIIGPFLPADRRAG